MRYKVTKQYPSSFETLCAEFIDFHDAKLFVEKCLHINETTNIKIQYWIFDHDKILSSHSSSQYANGGIPAKLAESFSVNTLENGIESMLARFDNLNDAKHLVEAKLKMEENTHKTYFILDGDKFVDKINIDNLDKENKKIFRPTPLPTKLRRGPTDYWVDEDEDHKK